MDSGLSLPTFISSLQPLSRQQRRMLELFLFHTQQTFYIHQECVQVLAKLILGVFVDGDGDVRGC